MYFNGALSLQPEGLRPITSLSTLNQQGYPYRLKTRYQTRWVSASWAALSAASKHSASWRTICQYPSRRTSLEPANPAPMRRRKRSFPMPRTPAIAPAISADVPSVPILLLQPSPCSAILETSAPAKKWIRQIARGLFCAYDDSNRMGSSAFIQSRMINL